jgi:3-dehydroquinate dehydratase
MMKKTFLGHEKALLTCMVQARNPDRIKELIALSRPEGAEAFGMQFCKLESEYRKPDVYRSLFEFASPEPTYVTNYRAALNVGKSDDELAREIIEIAECGATLCDVMGDYFDPTKGEMTMNATAVKKQMELIEKLHKSGSEVLMSSHVKSFIPAERVLEIALEHQRRGADISKIVTGAEDIEQEIENMRITALLKKELKIPFLFLSIGECRLLRRIGGELGSCTYLCVHEYDELATETQPLLKDVKALRDILHK